MRITRNNTESLIENLDELVQYAESLREAAQEWLNLQDEPRDEDTAEQIRDAREQYTSGMTDLETAVNDVAELLTPTRGRKPKVSKYAKQSDDGSYPAWPAEGNPVRGFDEAPQKFNPRTLQRPSNLTDAVLQRASECKKPYEVPTVVRRAFVACKGMTLNGDDARIVGISNDYATVLSFDSGNGVGGIQFAWPTVAHILLNRNGEFRS